MESEFELYGGTNLIKKIRKLATTNTDKEIGEII